MRLHKSTDRIEKEMVLRAPRSRVWRALADAEEFGTWFGIKLEGAFAPGASVYGQITMPDHELVTIEIAIERMDPESRLSYRSHPARTTRASPPRWSNSSSRKSPEAHDSGWSSQASIAFRWQGVLKHSG